MILLFSDFLCDPCGNWLALTGESGYSTKISGP
jgi:hypothetical protein